MLCYNERCCFSYTDHDYNPKTCPPPRDYTDSRITHLEEEIHTLKEQKHYKELVDTRDSSSNNKK